MMKKHNKRRKQSFDGFIIFDRSSPKTYSFFMTRGKVLQQTKRNSQGFELVLHSSWKQDIK